MKNKIMLISIIIGLCAICALIFFLILPSFSKETAPNIKTPVVKTFDSTADQDKTKNIRQPAVAGQFYPADKVELEKMIDNYLNQVNLNEYKEIPQIIIVPHAGFIYSGNVAAHAYKTLEKANFERVILIGRSHTAEFNGVRSDTSDFWQTPMGNVKVDQEFIELLRLSDAIQYDAEIHKDEHSLEVQVPFLIKTLGKDIKIVPLLFGSENIDIVTLFAQGLEKFIDNKTLIVISTDLSHYPNFADATDIDNQTIESILLNDIDLFRNKISELEKLNTENVSTLACAQPAVETAIILSQKLEFEPALLKYANSGDYFPEQKDRVVGYAAIAFTGSIESEDITKRELNSEEQKIALEIARKTLKNYFNQTDYEPNVLNYPIFQLKRGAFVTLKINGQLRGCIGNFEPEQELVQVIQNMALSAAFKDTRFQPLTAEEFKDVEIEISILSPREKITDHNLIEAGKHGVYVQKENKAGTYLPQVATENNWTEEEFLKSLCEDKSQIGPNCWLDPKTNLYIFTAQIITR